jgi:hypothetical protein
MIKYYISSVFCFCFTASIFAQKTKHKQFDSLPPYKHTIRVSPLSFIDVFQPSVTVGSEWHFNKKASVGLDVSTLIPLNIENTKRWGFILKPSFKYFIPALNSLGGNFFIEPDIFWKKQLSNQDGWLGKSVVNSIPAYYEYKNYTIVKDVVGLNFKIGTQSTLISKRLMTEVYVGAGIRVISKKIRNEPDAFFENDPWQLFTSGGVFGGRDINKTYWGISFPMGIRIAYIIK